MAAFSSPGSQRPLFPYHSHWGTSSQEVKTKLKVTPQLDFPPPESGTHQMSNKKSRHILDISHFEEPIHPQVLPILLPEHGSSQVQWLMLGIPAALRELRQGDCHKTGASFCYIVSSRPVLDTWWDSVSEIKRNQALPHSCQFLSMAAAFLPKPPCSFSWILNWFLCLLLFE